MHCKKCGRSFHQTEFHDHKCKSPKKPIETVQRHHVGDVVSEIIEGTLSVNSGKYHRLVGLRISDELLDKLDKARGGMTRPAKIREILEKEL